MTSVEGPKFEDSKPLILICELVIVDHGCRDKDVSLRSEVCRFLSANPEGAGLFEGLLEGPFKALKVLCCSRYLCILKVSGFCVRFERSMFPIVLLSVLGCSLLLSVSVHFEVLCAC